MTKTLEQSLREYIEQKNTCDLEYQKYLLMKRDLEIFGNELSWEFAKESYVNLDGVIYRVKTDIDDGGFVSVEAISFANIEILPRDYRWADSEWGNGVNSMSRIVSDLIDRPRNPDGVHKTGKVSGVFWEDFLEGDIDSVVAHVLKIYGRSADYATATIEIKETQYTVKVYRSEIQ